MICDKELFNIVGGVNYGALGLIAGAIVFLIGLLNGYQNPLKCRR